MRNEYPLVSCLMPTKNRRAFWPRAFSMFAAQDWPNKELIIVEDGEDSVGLESVNQYFDHISLLEPHRRTYKHFEGTLGAKLNEAARMASGEICINWDDDDWNAPNRISLQVAHMRLTGKPVVGFSSLIYYAEGKEHGWEYEGDSLYASGSSHCYTREWILAHPRPEITVGEDNIFASEARDLCAISNLSGTTCLVACDHPDNCSARKFGTANYEFMRETADNFRKVPLAYFASTIGPHGSH
jgi:O-antigen biosynthesis protein